MNLYIQSLLFGVDFFDSIDTIESIPLEYFGWNIAFGRSESYSNLIAKEDRIANIFFYSVFIFSLVGGIIFVMANGKTKLEKEKRTSELIIANKELVFQNEEKEKRADELIIALNELGNEKELTQKYLDDLILTGNIFENSIENAPIPIMIHAEDGTVLNISQNWTKLTYYTKSDIRTIFDWTKKAYGKNKDEVRDFIKKLYTLTENQHDGEFVVTTKDGRHLTWDFNSISLGNLPDGRAVAMSVATDVTERLAREQEINYLSYHDQLTGLYNRRFFEEQIKHLDNPKDLPLSIIMGDVNGLKLVNDAFGHLAGVLHHHERIDGKGYPNGISGDQIPIESKIIAVADAFDAMIAERPYRLTPLTLEETIAELQKYSGTQFDKTVVDVFVNKVLKSSDL